MTENIDQVRELEAEIDRANLRADRRAADLRVRGQQIRELEAENEWLRGHVRNAEDYLRLTHAYPGAGGWHDTLGADFGCGGCKLAQELKDALTKETGRG